MPTVARIDVLVAGDPWALPGSPGELAARGGRPCLWTRSNVPTTVRIRGTKSSLPRLGDAKTADGETWARWEIPATTAVSQTGPVEEEIRLSITCKGRPVEDVSVRIEGGLPTLDRSSAIRGGAQPGSDGDQWLAAGREAQGICGIHVETVNECYDERPPAYERWSGIAEGLGVRDWLKLLEVWRENQDPDEPRLALIVKIAHRFAGKLESICRRPRKVLRRVRNFERPDRLRQMDPSCLRWLARQPGRSHVERCGPKQRLLAVVRIENADTPENRIARDFLVRARRACQDYIFENQRRSEKQRVLEVRRFLALVNRLLLETEIGRVGQLVGTPEPNYVLLYDLRYRELWSWYQRLRRQQEEQDCVWQWRHRVWAETCLLALGECLEKPHPARRALDESVSLVTGDTLRGESLFGGPRSLVYLRTEQDGGQFIDQRSPIGPWVVQGQDDMVSVHVLRGEQLHLLDERQPEASLLAALSPDFILSAHRPGQRLLGGKVLAVWCELDFGLNGGGDLQAHVDSIYERLRNHVPGERIFGMLLQPRLALKDGTPEIKEHKSGASAWCLGLGLPSPIQAHKDWFRFALDALLSLE